MPYYLFKISRPEGMKLVKNLELLGVEESFPPASKSAKAMRAEDDSGMFDYKVMFAENQLAAEEQLLEKRDKPVLMEFER